MGVATLGFGWWAYDYLCKSKWGEDEKHLSAAVFAFTVIMAFFLTHVFSGRGAFIHFGAMLGTIMAANVYFVIMPGQQALVDATNAGTVPDPKYAANAKQRSVHNTYFTLPVLFVMISNHYAMTYGSAWNWLVLIMISVAGALIRVYFVKRHFGEASKTPIYAAGGLLFLCFLGMSPIMESKQAVAPTLAPATSAATVASGPSESAKTFTAVQSIVKVRCASCHAAKPTQAGFAAAPKGINLDTPQDIAKHAASIYQQSVLSKAMPIANMTKMTDDERAFIGQWYKAGAKQ